MGLDTVELVYAVEEAFGVEFADEDLSAATTVGDLFDLLLAALTESQGHGPLDRENIWRNYKRIVVEQLGVPSESVTLSASFVNDLRVD